MGIRLISVYLMSMYLTGVCHMGMHFLGIHLNKRVSPGYAPWAFISYAGLRRNRVPMKSR
jgi:hypothetical protein